MKVLCQPASQFPTFYRHWMTLNADSMNLPFFDVPFVQALIDHYFDGSEQFVIGYKHDGIAMFAGFFRPNGMGKWSLAVPSQCPLGMFMCQANKIDLTALSRIAEVLPGSVWMIDFLQIDTQFYTVEGSSQISYMPYIETGVRAIPQDFDEYYATLGKNIRQNCNKVINRAAREQDVLTSTKLSDQRDVLNAIKTYGVIESKGWKNKVGTAISPDNTQGRFYQKALSELAKTGKSCCWIYSINDKVVAVDLCVQQGSRLIILKTTYDEDYKKYSPAIMLKMDIMKHYSLHATAENITHIEFYGKAMDWHKRLLSELRPIVHFSWFRRPLFKSIRGIIKTLINKRS